MHPEGIGASVLRREDRRFLTGRGQYVSDLSFHDELHCAFVRSPHAHANIRSIDTTEALACPGVVAVYTGAEMEADRVGTMIPLWRRRRQRHERATPMGSLARYGPSRG